MQRLEVLFDELAELTGQRNAIDGRIVDIVAELDRDDLCGMTGARSIAALMAWKAGVTPRNAETMVAVARRIDKFPCCAEGLRDGRLSLDRVGVIAERAADGSDAHYAELAAVATVNQLRTAVKLEPRPDPEPRSQSQRSIDKLVEDEHTTWRIRLPRVEAAKFEAALQSHRDPQISEWKRDHEPRGGQVLDQAPPFPDGVDAFMSLIEAGWDAEAARRPHGNTPPSSCTSMSSNAWAPCIWARYSPTMNVATCYATPPARSGSSGTASRSGQAGAPARSAVGYAAHSKGETAAVWCPAAGAPVACTPITSCTGRTADSPI